MDELKRLELIAEAVQYCQRARSLGMPVNCYSKALREPIHFLWERRGGKTKMACATYRSKAAMGMRSGSGELIYDHAIPFNLLHSELLALSDVNPGSIADVLSRHGTVVLITKDENRRLNKGGLGRRLPPGWDNVDHLARYKTANIELVPNC